MRQLSLLSFQGRCAVCATLLLFCVVVLEGCMLLRIPLPPVAFTVDVFEDVSLRHLEDPIFEDPRIGVIGMEIPLARLCNLADAELVVRAYLERFEEEELGELANNIDVRRVYVEEIRLKAQKGDFSFVAEAGLRLRNNEHEVTYWSNFRDRNTKKVLVFKPDGKFDLFALLPGRNECVSTELIYSGTLPAEKVVLEMDMRLRVEADWRF
jgi:hypothetical protein